MTYVLHVLVVIEIYAIAGISLNLSMGYAGLVSVSHAAYFGIGAYATALLSTRLGAPFPLNMLGACIAAALVAVGVARLLRRVREDQFLFGTLAIQLLATIILSNWNTVTGGPMGLPDIPRPQLLSWRLDSQWKFALLGGVGCATALWLSAAISRSALGRVLRCVREDEYLAESIGKPVSSARNAVIVVGAILSGGAGALYSHYITFIDPSTFTLMESVFIISCVILGGTGTLWGPVLGAAILVALPEAMRFVGVPSSSAANLRQILYGLALIGCMLWRPQGIIGEYAFDAEKRRR